MIHALAKAGKVVLVPAVKRFVQGLPKANDEAFDKMRRETFEDWTIELGVRIQQQYEYLSPRIDGLDASVAALAEDVACMRLAANHARAADSEPTDERRRMLAFADAALIDSRLTVAKHSRVERILRELDPDDVLWLDVLDKVVGVRKGTNTFPHEDALRWSVWNDCPASDILVASACVRTRHVGGGAGAPDWDGAIVTREGRLVLHVLRLYVRARTPPIEVPGRERRPDDRTEEEAWRAVDSVPALRSAAIRMGAKVRPVYDSAKVDYRNGAPPARGAKATLRFVDAPADIIALSAHEAAANNASAGSPVSDVGVQVWDAGGDPPKRSAAVHGPHDVLRWLADEVDALWV